MSEDVFDQAVLVADIDEMFDEYDWLDDHLPCGCCACCGCTCDDVWGEEDEEVC